MSLKFYIHTVNHDLIDEKIDDLDVEIEYERTDLGFKGIIYGDGNYKDLLVDLCDDESGNVVSILLVDIDQNGRANGVGYNYAEGYGDLERESRGNNPETWHGIVYDGMHLDAEGLD